MRHAPADLEGGGGAAPGHTVPAPRALVATRTVLVSLAFSLALVGPAAGQQGGPLAPGVRLRVTTAAPAARTQPGVHRGFTDSTLVLATSDGVISIPLRAVTRLEVSQDRRPSVVGGIVGLLVGGATGGLAGCAANRDSYGVFCAGQSDTKVAVGAALGGIAGAAVGALLFRRERWELVPPERYR